MALPYVDDPFIGETERARRRKLAPRGTGTGEPGIEEGGNPLTAPYNRGNVVSKTVNALGAATAPNDRTLPPPGVAPTTGYEHLVTPPVSPPAAQQPDAYTRAIQQVTPQTLANAAGQVLSAPFLSSPTRAAIATPQAQPAPPVAAAPPAGPAPVSYASGQITPATAPVAYTTTAGVPPPPPPRVTTPPPIVGRPWGYQDLPGSGVARQVPGQVAAAYREGGLPAAAGELGRGMLATGVDIGGDIASRAQEGIGEVTSPILAGAQRFFTGESGTAPTLAQAAPIKAAAAAETAAPATRGDFGMNDRGAGYVQPPPGSPEGPRIETVGPTVTTPGAAGGGGQLARLQAEALGAAPQQPEPWRAEYARMREEEKGQAASQAQFFSDEAERNRRIAAGPSYRELETAKSEARNARMSGIGRRGAEAREAALQGAYSAAQAPESKRNLVAEQVARGIAADTAAGAVQARRGSEQAMAQAARMNPLAYAQGLQQLSGARTAEEAARMKVAEEQISLNLKTELNDPKTTDARKSQILEQMHALAGKTPFKGLALGGGVNPETGYANPQTGVIYNELTGKYDYVGGPPGGQLGQPAGKTAPAVGEERYDPTSKKTAKWDGTKWVEKK